MKRFLIIAFIGFAVSMSAQTAYEHANEPVHYDIYGKYIVPIITGLLSGFVKEFFNFLKEKRAKKNQQKADFEVIEN